MLDVTSTPLIMMPPIVEGYESVGPSVCAVVVNVPCEGSVGRMIPFGVLTSMLPEDVSVYLTSIRFESVVIAASRWSSRPAVLCPSAWNCTICFEMEPIEASAAFAASTPLPMLSSAVWRALVSVAARLLNPLATLCAAVTTADWSCVSVVSLSSVVNALCRLERLWVSEPVEPLSALVSPSALTIPDQLSLSVVEAETAEFCAKRLVCSAADVTRVMTPDATPETSLPASNAMSDTCSCVYPAVLAFATFWLTTLICA